MTADMADPLGVAVLAFVTAQRLIDLVYARRNERRLRHHESPPRYRTTIDSVTGRY